MLLGSSSGVWCIGRHTAYSLFKIMNIIRTAYLLFKMMSIIHPGLLRGACDPLPRGAGATGHRCSAQGAPNLHLDAVVAPPQTGHASHPERTVPPVPISLRGRAGACSSPGRAGWRPRAGGSQGSHQGRGGMPATLRHRCPQCIFRKLRAGGLKHNQAEQLPIPRLASLRGTTAH